VKVIFVTTSFKSFMYFSLLAYSSAYCC